LAQEELRVGWRKLLTSMIGLVDQELLVRHD